MDDANGAELDPLLDAWRAAGAGTVVALTGAGISAESGIPTFRGADGYWTHGSRNYTPMELATRAAFEAEPEIVWQFYLERIVRHRDAAPNPGHRALVTLEQALGERFQLITQNVDGLHLRAGSDPRRLFAIHGDLSWTRCAADCGAPVEALPDALRALDPAAVAFDGPVRAALTCRCGGLRRPHVLWFDECYDEEHFRWDSSLGVARRMGLLLVIGTSGATNLPNRLVDAARARRIPLIVVGLDDSPFTELAERVHHGVFVRGSASAVLPPLVERILSGEVVG